MLTKCPVTHVNNNYNEKYKDRAVWFTTDNWQLQSSAVITQSIIYCKILHEYLQELRQNINQMLDPQMTNAKGIFF